MHDDGLFLPLRTHQAQAMATIRRRHGNTVELRQIGHGVRRALANQLVLARHQHLHALAQPLDDHAAAVVERQAHTQRHVDALLQQIHRSIEHQHFQLDLRVALEELRHQLAEHRLRQRDRAGHPHGAARRALDLCDRIGGRLRLFPHRLTVAQIGLAHLGQRQLAGGALQQTHAQLLLELGDPAREPRLRNAQTPARRREPAALDHLGEIQHVIQVLHGNLSNWEDIQDNLSQNHYLVQRLFRLHN